MPKQSDKHARDRAYYRRNAEQKKADRRAFRAQHRDRINAQRRAAYASSPEKRAKVWEGNIRQKYGLTREQFEAMRAAQHNQCAICDREMLMGNFGATRACIDHHHGTGKVRGLLCHRCNLFVGKLENIKLRDAALRYLARHEVDQ